MTEPMEIKQTLTPEEAAALYNNPIAKTEIEQASSVEELLAVTPKETTSIKEPDEEPVFLAGTFGDPDEPLAGMDYNGEVKSVKETAVAADLSTQPEKLDQVFVEESVYIRDEETHYFDERTQTKDPIAELSEALPALEIPPEIKPATKADTKNEKSATEILNEVRKIVSATDGVSGYWDPRVVSGEEKQKTSNKVEIDPRRPILTNGRKFDPTNEEHIRHVLDSVSLPPDARDNIIRYVVEHPSILEDDNPAMKVTSLSEGMELMGDEPEYHREALNDPQTEIKQHYTLPAGQGSISSHRSMMKSEDGPATGLRARAAIMDAFGLSSYFTAVLPHSGLVAVISAPLVNELVDLQTQMDNNKINVGRTVGGSNYGTMTWYNASKIVDLFIRKIEQVNVKGSTPELLRQLIDPMDIPTIAWALTAARYPEGYRYNRVSLGDDGKTSMIIGDLHLTDIAHPLNSRLSLRQKQHLRNGETQLSSVEEIESYKRNWLNKEDIVEFARVLHSRTIRQSGTDVTKETILVLDTTSMENYIQHGSNWDVYLTESLDEVLSMTSDERMRSTYLSRKIIASSLREFSYLIKEIRVKTTYQNTGESVIQTINGPEHIISMLDTISVEDKLNERVREIVVEYINSKTKIVYGVPVASDYEVKQLENQNAISTSIIPINPTLLFFILTGRTYQSLGM